MLEEFLLGHAASLVFLHEAGDEAAALLLQHRFGHIHFHGRQEGSGHGLRVFGADRGLPGGHEVLADPLLQILKGGLVMFLAEGLVDVGHMPFL